VVELLLESMGNGGVAVLLLVIHVLERSCCLLALEKRSNPSGSCGPVACDSCAREELLLACIREKKQSFGEVLIGVLIRQTISMKSL